MPPAVPETLPFGKHKGLHIAAVPTDYLEWVILNFRTPCEIARRELERRCTATSGPDAILARQALNRYHWKHARRLSNPRPKWKGKSRDRRKDTRARKVRYTPPANLAKLKRDFVIVGDNYAAAHAAWLAGGGNPNECPF